MVRFLILVVSLLQATTTTAQKMRFTEPSNQWKLLFVDVDAATGFNQVAYMSDTIVHGRTYKQLTNSGRVIVREDTTLKKVFAVDLDYADTIESTLYDYTLQVGDTFKCRVAMHYVESIDSVLIGTVWHRIWNLLKANCDSCPTGYMVSDYKVIEGIGSTSQPTKPLDPTYFEGGYALVCFSSSGITPVLDHKVGYYFDNSNSCTSSFGVYVSSMTGHFVNTTIYPSPATTTITITAPTEINEITLLDITGRNATSPAAANGKHELSFSVAHLPAGIYFVKVNGVYAGRFVKE